MRRLEPASSPALPTRRAIARAAVRTSEIVRGGDGDAGAAAAVASATSPAIKPRMSGLMRPRTGGNGAAAVEEQSRAPAGGASGDRRSPPLTPSRPAMRPPASRRQPGAVLASERRPGGSRPRRRASRARGRRPPWSSPTSPPPPEASPEEPSAPARKGWWQRRFSGGQPKREAEPRTAIARGSESSRLASESSVHCGTCSAFDIKFGARETLADTFSPQIERHCQLLHGDCRRLAGDPAIGLPRCRSHGGTDEKARAHGFDCRLRLGSAAGSSGHGHRRPMHAGRRRGHGLMEGFASFMAEAAMKNSAKARLGEAVKIGKVSKKCEWKTVSYECQARAQACR